jgi:hypothetical protein
LATGMEGFAAGARALAGQAQGLRAAVDAGQLVMDPEAAERVARLYDQKADDFRGFQRDTRQLIATGAFGDCFIGRELEKKFELKVNDPEVGVVAILSKTEEILKGMAQAYRDSAREMQSADEERGRDLGRIV